MHAGYPMADRMRALMFSYPQVHVDLGSIIYTEPRPAFYSFLRELVEAGYLPFYREQNGRTYGVFEERDLRGFQNARGGWHDTELRTY